MAAYLEFTKTTSRPADGSGDIVNFHRIGELRDQAARCRRLINAALDSRTLKALTATADEYEAEAAHLAQLAGHQIP